MFRDETSYVIGFSGNRKIRHSFETRFTPDLMNRQFTNKIIHNVLISKSNHHISVPDIVKESVEMRRIGENRNSKVECRPIVESNAESFKRIVHCKNKLADFPEMSILNFMFFNASGAAPFSISIFFFHVFFCGGESAKNLFNFRLVASFHSRISINAVNFHEQQPIGNSENVNSFFC